MANDLTKFDMAERAERLVGEIYRLLAKRFAGDAEYRVLFEKLADEEDQHAMRVAMLRTQYFNAKVTELELDVAAMEGYLAGAEKLKERLTGEEHLLIGQALAAMADIEAQFSGVHAHMMLSASDPGLKKFFAQFTSQDKAHALQLRRRLA
jgi:rubrerythrin